MIDTDAAFATSPGDRQGPLTEGCAFRSSATASTIVSEMPTSSGATRFPGAQKPKPWVMNR
jgi:hypothetical protein